MDIQPRTSDVQPVSRVPAAGRVSEGPNQSKKPSGKKMPWRLLAIIVAVVIVAGAAWYFLRGRDDSGVDSSKYQAVFLENNQVYFGKLYGYNTGHPYLKNVWYIETQPGQSDTSKAPTSSSQMQLKHLTDAVHGPDDEMLLNKSQILFVENLSGNSQVVKLINSSKNK